MLNLEPSSDYLHINSISITNYEQFLADLNSKLQDMKLSPV